MGYQNVFLQVSELIAFHDHAAFTMLYLSSWSIAMQYLYYEVNIRYLTVMEFLNNKRKRIHRRPTSDLMLAINQTIDDMRTNESSMSSSVSPIKYFIIISIISRNFALIYFMSSLSDYNFSFNVSLIVYLLVYDFYFISTQVLIYWKSYITIEIKSFLFHLRKLNHVVF